MPMIPSNSQCASFSLDCFQKRDEGCSLQPLHNMPSQERTDTLSEIPPFEKCSAVLSGQIFLNE